MQRQNWEFQKFYKHAFEVYLRRGLPIDVDALEWEFKSETHQDHSTPLYIWRTRGDNRVRPAHRANEGKIFSWKMPPATGHPGEAPNCRCSAQPYRKKIWPELEHLDGEDLGVMLALLQHNNQPLIKAWWAWMMKNPEARGWKLEETKGRIKWGNQIYEGNWTPDKITEIIRTAPHSKVFNSIRPENPTTRYQLNGKHVVLDDVTKEIIQLSRPKFNTNH